jgi:2-oxoglutarate ferredoxin oxidoreductase subunit alpha
MGKSKVKQEEATGIKEAPLPIINDFILVVATVNGSGSQTSNLALVRAFFRMGLPVSGKNIFPSNIQGLPTWYTIRVNADGHTANKQMCDLLVAMNMATFHEDLTKLKRGGVCIYDDRLAEPTNRPDVIFYPIPIRDLVKEVNPSKQLRDYVANMAYVGVLAEILEIDMDEIRGALSTHFGDREKSVRLNMHMVELAAAWVRENLPKRDPYRVERMAKDENLMLVDGNTAAALGAIYGGVTVASWYPITPASSLAETLEYYLPHLRKDPETGKATYAVIQAEDEIAAIGMAVGAGWVGARAMTSTSGPGISLMTEIAGLAFFAEIPIVIWDVQRMGPSTGLPTRTSQGDVLPVRFLGHGDTRHTILIPGTPQECFEFGWRAFDLAERYQTPIFVLSDLDLGMNLWISEPFQFPEEAMDRGKVLSAEALEELGEYARYRDVDKDGIPPRTIPGTDHPLAAFFTRGTGHNDSAIYSEKAEDWDANIERLWRKLETARLALPTPIILRMDNTRIGIIAYGSTDPAVIEAREILAKKGLPTDYLRIRAIPFSDEVEEFIQDHEIVNVVEMNTDGQMHKLLQLEYPEMATKLISLTRNNGVPLDANWTVDAVLKAEEESHGG